MGENPQGAAATLRMVLAAMHTSLSLSCTRADGVGGVVRKLLDITHAFSQRLLLLRVI